MSNVWINRINQLWWYENGLDNNDINNNSHDNSNNKYGNNHDDTNNNIHSNNNNENHNNTSVFDFNINICKQKINKKINKKIFNTCTHTSIYFNFILSFYVFNIIQMHHIIRYKIFHALIHLLLADS